MRKLINGKNATRFPLWRKRGTICAADGGKWNAVCQSEGRHAKRFPFWKTIS